MKGIVVPTLRRGDRVRVVLEGIVGSVDGGFAVCPESDEDELNWIVPEADHVVSIEKIVPRPKVGDKYSGSEMLSREFAVGTVVRDIEDEDTMLWDGDVWYSSLQRDSYEPRELAAFDDHDGFEVVYVPVTA